MIPNERDNIESRCNDAGEYAQKGRLLFRISPQIVGCITEQVVLLELRTLLSRELGAYELGRRRASGKIGSNSSMGLPDGSSTRICLPPIPVTISLRKWAPALRSASTVVARSETSSANRFQPPGCGNVPSGMA